MSFMVHGATATIVNIKPFADETVVNRFSCGKRPLDQFIKSKAKKSVRRHECRVFCAHLGDSETVIGYYALQVGSDSVASAAGTDYLTT